MEAKPKIGITACLVGENVRYDGGNRLDASLVSALGPLVEWVPVCPEAEMGLGVPREPMHLEGNPDDPYLVTNDTRIDHTKRMQAWARDRAAALQREGTRGFILKSRSPSCGLRSVAIITAEGSAGPVSTGSGLFARALLLYFPSIVLVDNEALADDAARLSFIAQANR